jgi:transposase
MPITTLFELPDPQPLKPEAPTGPQQARVLRPVRNQLEWAPRELDALIAEDHPARTIWTFLERLDLSRFYAAIKSVLGRAGHPTTDPQVLLALRLYACCDGIGSARHIDRLCKEHDAYRWICGGVPINYHTLSDFRVAHQEALDELLTEILAAIMDAGLVTLRCVAQDGMRVRASARAPVRFGASPHCRIVWRRRRSR